MAHCIWDLIGVVIVGYKNIHGNYCDEFLTHLVL